MTSDCAANQQPKPPVCIPCPPPVVAPGGGGQQPNVSPTPKPPPAVAPGAGGQQPGISPIPQPPLGAAPGSSGQQPGVPPTPRPLVLTECKVTASIVDVHSWVTLSQKFHNPSTSVANQVTYNFSVLGGSAICSFVVIREDGTRVAGVVKEREQAQRELESALKAGQTAALGQEVTKDIFSISVGNVNPKETITIDLGYMSPLIDDEDPNQIRFTLPRTYMQRYGTSPPGVNTAQVAKYEDVQFSMDVTIQQATPIRQVFGRQGPSLTVSLGKPPGSGACGVPDSHFAQVTISSNGLNAGPQSDIVIVIEADKLDSPRALIESHPSPDQHSVAIGLTLVPRFRLADPACGMEYIVLVDRSGSMEGIRLSMTQHALVTLMRGLPSRKTTFNIFSFGSKVSKLWPKSQAYDDVTLSEATKYIDGMKADYGGTNVAVALDSVFNSLPSRLDRPVSVFLITDGGHWDVQSCLTKVEQAVKTRSTPNSYLRVFTVGIGDGVSTEMCDSIARVGNGASLYIVSPSEKYVGKCARLVHAARTPPVTDIKINWLGANVQPCDQPIVVRPDPTPVNLFEEDLQYHNDDTGAPVRLRQAPVRVQSMFPATRTEIFAIVPKYDATQDSCLVLTGKIPSTDESIALNVRLQRIAPIGSFARLHTRAAKAIVTERELGRSEIHKDPTANDLKDDIINLGLRYGLTSRHTSFLAVDNGGSVIGKADAPSPSGLPHGLFAVPVPQIRAAVATRGGIEPASFLRTSDPFADTAMSFIQEQAATSGTETAEVLDKVVRMQRFDGSFGEESTEVVQLIDGLGGWSAQEALAKFDGVDDLVKAVVLTWAWMRVSCGEEVVDIVEKMDLWLRENVAKSVDVDELERQVAELQSFGA